MSIFDPTSNPEALHVVELGGKSTRGMGKAWVEGFSAPRKWDEQAGYATDGSSLKFTGNGLSEGTLKIQCWLPEHFVAWADFQTIVKETKPGGPPPTALDLRNPISDDIGVTQVVITDEGQWELVDDTGLWERSIKLKKFRKPKPMLATPDASIDKPKSDDEAPTREELLLQQLQGSLDEAKRQDAATP